jgi:hypothetical protein
VYFCMATKRIQMKKTIRAKGEPLGPKARRVGGRITERKIGPCKTTSRIVQGWSYLK